MSNEKSKHLGFYFFVDKGICFTLKEGKGKKFSVCTDLIRDALVGSGSRHYGARGGRRSSLRRRHFNAPHPDHRSRSSGEGRNSFYLRSFFKFIYLMKFVQFEPVLAKSIHLIQLQS